MARPGDAAANRLLNLLTSHPGINENLETLGQIESARLAPLHMQQIAVQNIAFELVERSTDVRYPAIYIYCEKIANLQTEKFRRFSGKAHMAIEVRLSQDRMEGLEKALQLYADAATQILEQNRGDWGQGMYYTGGYEIAFSPVKKGGRNFIQIAKITFEVGASNN